MSNKKKKPAYDAHDSNFLFSLNVLQKESAIHLNNIEHLSYLHHHLLICQLAKGICNNIFTTTAKDELTAIWLILAPIDNLRPRIFSDKIYLITFFIDDLRSDMPCLVLFTVKYKLQYIENWIQFGLEYRLNPCH